MKIRAIKCIKCGDTIYSRANHDYATCSCGGCSIDGGQENKWFRVSGDADCIEDASFELDVTLEELYNDWNTGADKHGKV